MRAACLRIGLKAAFGRYGGWNGASALETRRRSGLVKSLTSGDAVGGATTTTLLLLLVSGIVFMQSPRPISRHAQAAAAVSKGLAQSLPRRPLLALPRCRRLHNRPRCCCQMNAPLRHAFNLLLSYQAVHRCVFTALHMRQGGIMGTGGTAAHQSRAHAHTASQWLMMHGQVGLGRGNGVLLTVLQSLRSKLRQPVSQSVS
jgi:hypothetical protein